MIKGMTVLQYLYNHSQDLADEEWRIRNRLSAMKKRCVRQNAKSFASLLEKQMALLTEYWQTKQQMTAIDGYVG